MSAEAPKWDEDEKADVYSLTSDIEIRDYGENADSESGKYEVGWPTKASPIALLQAFDIFLREAREESERVDSDEDERSYTIELKVESGVNLTDSDSEKRILEIHVATEFGEFKYDRDDEDNSVQFISEKQLARPLSRFILATTSDIGIKPEKLTETLRIVGRNKARDPLNRVMDNLTTSASLLPVNEDISLN